MIWLTVAGSIEENILLNRPVDRENLNKCIESCYLTGVREDTFRMIVLFHCQFLILASADMLCSSNDSFISVINRDLIFPFTHL
jgi:hypothetical protein